MGVDDDPSVSTDACKAHMAEMELKIKEWITTMVAEAVATQNEKIADLQGQLRTMLYFAIVQLIGIILTLGGVFLGRMIDLHIGL